MTVSSENTNRMADSNFTSDEMDNLMYVNGFKWSAVSWEWWVLCQTCLIFVGLFGNTCIIYIYTFKLRECSSMDKLIRGLAIADLCTSLGLAPIPWVERVPDSFISHLYCKVIFTNNLLWISIVASVYTLTMMSVDRCLAIVYPIHYRLFFSKSRTKIILLLVWIASFLTNACAYAASYRDYKSESCTWNPGPVLRVCIGVFIFNFEYLIPMVVMVSTHLMTLKSLRSQTASLVQHDRLGSYMGTPRDRLMLRVNQRLLRMLFVVVLTFIICWTSDQVCFLLLSIGILKSTYLYSNIYHTIVLVAFVNSCANPFIYTASNPQFRKALKTFFQEGGEATSDPGTGLGVTVSGRESSVFSINEATRDRRLKQPT